MINKNEFELTQPVIERKGKIFSNPSTFLLVQGAILALGMFAFSPKVRKEILTRDNFQCVNDGKSGEYYKLEAAHYDHDRQNPKYDTPENGRSLCISCHDNDTADPKVDHSWRPLLFGNRITRHFTDKGVEKITENFGKDGLYYYLPEQETVNRPLRSEERKEQTGQWSKQVKNLFSSK